MKMISKAIYITLMLFYLQPIQSVDWARVKEIRGFLARMIDDEPHKKGFLIETKEYYREMRENGTANQLHTKEYIDVLCEIAAKHSHDTKEYWIGFVERHDQRLQRMLALKAIYGDRI